jgi:hypothetical protein
MKCAYYAIKTDSSFIKRKVTTLPKHRAMMVYRSLGVNCTDTVLLKDAVSEGLASCCIALRMRMKPQFHFNKSLVRCHCRVQRPAKGNPLPLPLQTVEVRKEGDPYVCTAYTGTGGSIVFESEEQGNYLYLIIS